MAAEEVRKALSCSGRAICRWLGINRSTLRYRPRPRPDRARLIEGVASAPDAWIQEDRGQAEILRLHRQQEARPAGSPGGRPSGSASPGSCPAPRAVYRTAAEGRAPQPRMGLGLRLGPYAARRQASRLQPDRRVHAGMPLHPRGPRHQGGGCPVGFARRDRRAWAARVYSLGQRSGVHRQGYPEVARVKPYKDAVYRSRLPLAEWIRGKLQRPLPAGVPGPRADIYAQRIPRDLLGLAETNTTMSVPIVRWAC